MRTAKRTGLSLRLVRALAAATMMTALPSVLASCASSGTASGTAGAGNASIGRVITLNHINTLKALFNRDDGRTRLILIFSPT